MSKCKYTSIGGQALIEGIMMKSPEKSAMAVRTKEGNIEIFEPEEINLRKRYEFLKYPVLRGVISFVESLINGYKALMLSAEKSGFTDLEEEETPKTEKDEKKDSLVMNIVMVVASVLGVLLAIFLFTALPRLVVGLLEDIAGRNFYTVTRSLIEQFLKLAIFVVYVWGVSYMKDIKRTFMYHGAEHKTIFCYEKGLELTVENVKRQKRFHPRCGTSFMILMILISVIISTLVQIMFRGAYDSAFVWILIKIALIPLTCGVGYEVLKLCGKYDNIWTKIISAPGLWLQRITTKEPDEGMIEVAISAFNACLTKDEEPKEEKIEIEPIITEYDDI